MKNSDPTTKKPALVGHGLQSRRALSSSVEKAAGPATVKTVEGDALDTEFAKHAIRRGTGALEPAAATFLAIDRLSGHQRYSLRLRFHLAKLRAKRLVLGLKICALSLKCRVFGLNEPQSLLEDRRRAMFVDEFFQKFKHGTTLISN